MGCAFDFLDCCTVPTDLLLLNELFSKKEDNEYHTERQSFV